MTVAASPSDGVGTKRNGRFEWSGPSNSCLGRAPVPSPPSSVSARVRHIAKCASGKREGSHPTNSLPLCGCILAALILPLTLARAETPEPVAMSGKTQVAIVHAQGAQVYECKADAAGRLAWQLREPIATLLEAGKTVGRHYAGPYWELADGSTVTAKVVGRAPGATSSDIPLLKLEVTSRRGVGKLSTVTGIQRLNTKGGALEGACTFPGEMTSIPYAADYAFWHEPR
jgi:hypothetical protein